MFVLGNEDGFETPLPVARDVDPQRAVFRHDSLAADAVAVVARTFGLAASA